MRDDVGGDDETAEENTEENEAGADHLDSGLSL